MGNWNLAYVTTFSQTNNSWLAPGWHSIQEVLFNGGGGAGPNSGWNLGFGWDLAGDYSSNTLAAGASTQTNTSGGPSSGGVAATQNLSGVTNAGFVMPIDNGSGNVYQSQPVNSFSNSLTITADSTLDLTASGAVNIFTGGLSIGANALHIINGQSIAGSVQINGASTLTGGTATLDVQNSNTLTLYGAISGAGAIDKIGSGTLVLGNANSYSGGTTLNAGQLTINYASALGTGPLTITGGSLDSGGITVSTNNVQYWNGDFTFIGSSNLNLGSGAVTLGGNRTVTVNANTLTVGGAIGDGGNGYSLTKAGNGTLALGGASTYTGATTVNAGTVNLTGTLGGGTGGGTAITVASGSTFTEAATGVIAGSSSFTHNSGNTSTLAGANSYTGGTIINSGVVDIKTTTSLGTGNVTASGGQLLVQRRSRARLPTT